MSQENLIIFVVESYPGRRRLDSIVQNVIRAVRAFSLYISSHTNTVNKWSALTWLFAQDCEKWICAFGIRLRALDLFMFVQLRAFHKTNARGSSMLWAFAYPIL